MKSEEQRVEMETEGTKDAVAILDGMGPQQTTALC
jgi:hypothetical protein